MCRHLRLCAQRAVHVRRDRKQRTLVLSQEAYVSDLLERYSHLVASAQGQLNSEQMAPSESGRYSTKGLLARENSASLMMFGWRYELAMTPRCCALTRRHMLESPQWIA